MHAGERFHPDFTDALEVQRVLDGLQRSAVGSTPISIAEDCQVSTATEPGLSSKTRWTIVGLLSASIAINLLDRQIFSALAPLLRETFSWSNTHTDMLRWRSTSG